MKLSKLKSLSLWFFCIIILIAAIIVTGIFCSDALHHTKTLEKELKAAKKKEKEATVTRIVSKQMEEIAFQQKEISDKRHIEAITQTAIANKMRQRAEQESERALAAQQEALEASLLAKKQKQIAEERHQQAEYSRKVADTLAYLALGRSLGSFAITQYQSGNTELAKLLAYAAWKFTETYHGDVYQHAIFNSLLLCGKQWQTELRHKGAITCITMLPSQNKYPSFVTAGKYGEIFHWTFETKGEWQVKKLLSDPQYDFRDIYIDDDSSTLYALSYTGKIVLLSNDSIKETKLEGTGSTTIIPTPDGLTLVSTDDIIYLNEQEQRRKTVDAEKYNPGHPITAYSYSSDNKLTAFGYKDGTLILLDTETEHYRKLSGHRSAITCIQIKSDKLYSSSYDCSLRLWNINSEKIEPTIIFETSTWLHTIALTADGHTLLAGEDNGSLHILSVSPLHMATALQQNLKRDFTRREWDYYIGAQIPREQYIISDRNL